MLVVIKEPGKAPSKQDIEGSLTNLQSIVGGYIEVVYHFRRHDPQSGGFLVVIGNEDGHPLKLPDNHFHEIQLVGTYLICAQLSGHFAPLTEAEAQLLLDGQL